MKYVSSYFRKLDREEAISKHKEQDTDGDGKVTWADYLNEVYSYKPDDIEEFRKDKSDDMKSFVEVSLQIYKTIVNGSDW